MRSKLEERDANFDMKTTKPLNHWMDQDVMVG